jgi:hypothetical protein
MSKGEELYLASTYQFRVNGIIITEVKVRPVMLDGSVDHWELVARHEKLGEFPIELMLLTINGRVSTIDLY